MTTTKNEFLLLLCMTEPIGSGSESPFGFMRGNVLVMTVTRIFRMFSRSAAFPYFSLYVLALGGDAASIGIVSSLRPLASLLIFPLAGYFADRMSRVRLIVLAGYLSASIYLLQVFASDWVILAIAGFLLGLIVFQFPARSALMADSLSPRQRGIGFAASRAIPGAVAVVAPTFAGYLIQIIGVESGVRYLYAFVVVTYAISATINMRFLKDTVQATALDMSNLKEIIRESYRSVTDILKWMPKNLKALALIITLCRVANAIAGPFWVVYATTEIGLSAGEWGILIAAYSAVRIVLSLPAGAAVDRFGRRKTITAALTLCIAPLLLFMNSRRFEDILLVLLSLSIVNAFLPPSVAALMADIVPREMRGRVMAAFGRGTIMIAPGGGGGGGPGMGYVLALPVMVGSLLGGYIYSLSPASTWLLQSVLTLGSLFLVLAFLHEPERAET